MHLLTSIKAYFCIYKHKHILSSSSWYLIVYQTMYTRLCEHFSSSFHIILCLPLLVSLPQWDWMLHLSLSPPHVLSSVPDIMDSPHFLLCEWVNKQMSEWLLNQSKPILLSTLRLSHHVPLGRSCISLRLVVHLEAESNKCHITGSLKGWKR